MPLAVGEAFAEYTILRELGAGAMGTVYLAQHPRLPRQDALKVLSAELTTDPQYRARFLRDGGVAANLSHPHIAGVHECGEDHGQLWISTDYVKSTDLGRLLRERYRGGMPIDDALQIIDAVASALDYAHRRGLLHRGVKPANILLTEPDPSERGIFLTDFGVVRRSEAGKVDPKVAADKAAYAAPEQLLSEPDYPAADQYSLACTAFHLLTGAPPFGLSNITTVINGHVTASPPAIGARRRDLAALNSVFARAMAKTAIGRYRSCQDFSRELQQRLT